MQNSIKYFSAYQIVGAILGFIAMYISVSDDLSFSDKYLLASYAIIFFFFSLSLAGGVLLLSKKHLILGLNLCIVSMALQIFSVAVGHVVLSLVSGVGILGIIDISQSAEFGMEFLVSNVEVRFEQLAQTFYFKLNFLAVGLFIWLMNKRKEIIENLNLVEIALKRSIEKKNSDV